MVRVGVHCSAHPSPFTISIITYKVVVCAAAERAETLPLFLLYPYMYSVGSSLSMTYPLVYFIHGPYGPMHFSY
jgi:hypothetical protein